jgi:hypothetical protein
MSVAKGTEAYNADMPPVLARGYLYAQGDFDTACAERLQAVLTDEPGRSSLAELYGSLELTQFGNENVTEALQPIPQEEHSRGWREGEALAEAWLVDHKECEFPWPFNRDLRHQRASLPGAELVGFTGVTPDETQFAFGQVKTSKELRNPPQVVHSGAKSLTSQALQLRDDWQIKATVVDYLAYRATSDVPWATKFRSAATRYFNSGKMAIAIFGVLVRDVVPTAADLQEAARHLSTGCHESTRIELVGLYLPEGSIPAGPQHGPRPRRRTGT